MAADSEDRYAQLSGNLRRDLGLEHRYDPPIVLAPEAVLRAGERRAFTAMLPHPPNGDAEDQAFFYKLSDHRIAAYFNRCTHVSIPMDFDDGEFLDNNGFIMCRLHGARYELETGLRCLGPARTNLTRIVCEEDDEGRLIVYGWEKVR